MVKILRMERPDGTGPFEYGNKLSFIGDETESGGYWHDFSKATGWLGITQDWLFGTAILDIPPDHMPHGNDIPDVWDGKVSADDQHPWRVGVSDMKQFNHWFPVKSYPFFNKFGFELVEYEAPARYVHIGGHQLMFCVTDSKVVERRPLVK